MCESATARLHNGAKPVTGTVHFSSSTLESITDETVLLHNIVKPQGQCGATLDTFSEENRTDQI